MDETIDVLVKKVKQMNKSSHRLGYFNKAVKKYFNQKICEYKNNKDFDALNCCRDDFRKMYEFNKKYDNKNKR